MTFTAYALAVNADVQQRLRQEITEAVAADGGQLKYDTVMSLKYLDAVVNETLRHYSPVIKIERQATSDYKIESLAVPIKKGDRIQVPIYAIHHDPDLFPDPDTFNPDRFMPDHKHQLVPCSFLPFMTGPRNCIGARFALLEAKTTIAAILMSYDICRSDKTAVPLDLSRVTLLMQAKDVTVKYAKRAAA